MNKVLFVVKIALYTPIQGKLVKLLKVCCFVDCSINCLIYGMQAIQ